MQVLTKIDLDKIIKDDAKILSEKIEELKADTRLEEIIADGAYASDDP